MYNTGIGIQASDLELVTKPFGQSRASIDLTHQGAGIGLALSKKLVERLGGSLVIDSRENADTTVSLRFPNVT